MLKHGQDSAKGKDKTALEFLEAVEVISAAGACPRGGPGAAG